MSVSDTKTVHQVIDWIGGDGIKPVSGLYVGPNGLTSDIGQATNIKGNPGVAINDNVTSPETTWSSQKITQEMEEYIPKSYLDEDPDMAANSDDRIATQRATKLAIARQRDSWALREW